MTVERRGLLQLESLNLPSGASLFVSSLGTVQVSDGLTSPSGVTVSGGLLVTSHVDVSDLSLLNGGLLTSLASTADQMHKLEVDLAGTLIVDATSRIDVSSKGHLPGRTDGNTTQGGATGQAGGTHGGSGGPLAGTTNSPYGDIFNPETWGSGGSAEKFDASQGGGLVRLRAAALTLDGGIAAQGGTAGTGGAGGGISIDTEQLEGTGWISASGGNGSPGGTVKGGGGGGGRVAVYARSFGSFDTSRITAYGGIGTFEGGTGTVYLRDKDDPHGTLLIDAGSDGAGWTPLGLPGVETFTIPDDVVIRGERTHVGLAHPGVELVLTKSLTVQNNGLLHLAGNLHLPSGASMHASSLGTIRVQDTLTLDGSIEVLSGGIVQADNRFVSPHAVAISGGTLVTSYADVSDLSLLNGGVLTSLTSTADQMHKLELDVAGTLLVDAKSGIDVTNKGYLAGRTTGNTTAGAATGEAGGSYGGRGANYYGTANRPYGDMADPEDWGSGGAKGDYWRGHSAGGGLVRLVTDILQLDGRISSNGVHTASGGGIYVVASTLLGEGSITARGADGSYLVGASGGGGRIAVYAEDLTSFDVSKISAPGGKSRDSIGQAGTVHIVQGRPHTHVQSHEPFGVPGDFVGRGNGRVNQPFDHITLRFNKPISVASLAENLVIDGPFGPITPLGISLVGDRTYRIDLNRQSENGRYHVSVLRTLLDEEGFELDQDADGVPGELEDGYSFTLVLDTVAPRITRHSPAGDVAGTVDHVDVWFSEPIDLANFGTADIAITGPGGEVIPVGGLQEVGLNRFRIAFAPPVQSGEYRIAIGPDIRDPAGNLLDQDRDGIFGETGDDVYIATFNLVDVDLGLADLTTSATELVAGQSVNVSWNGANRSDAPLLGEWVDGVYLSADDQWDIGDTLLATVPHTGGLAAR